MNRTRSLQTLPLLLLCFMLTACGQAPATTPKAKPNSSVSQVLEQKTGVSQSPAETDAAPSEIPKPTAPPESSAPNNRLKEDGTYDKIDLDLSPLNETLTYAELATMALMPEDYEGKVIRIKGQFSHYVQPKTGETHYTLFLMDVTACCGQVLDFTLHDPNVHLENEITENETITVTGLFQIYEENAEFGISSYRLVDSYIS